jgi:uncharacterized membrane protein
MKKNKKIIIIAIIVIIILIVGIGLNIKFNPTYNVTEEFEHCESSSTEGVFDIKGTCYPILIYKNINNKLFCFIKGGNWKQVKLNEYSCVVPNK